MFVLIMIFTMGSAQGGMTTIQRDFGSFATCENARKSIAKAHDRYYAVTLVSQGCYKK